MHIMGELHAHSLDNYCDDSTIKDILKGGEMEGSREMSSQYFWQEKMSLNDDKNIGTVNESTDARKGSPGGEILS